MPHSPILNRVKVDAFFSNAKLYINLKSSYWGVIWKIAFLKTLCFRLYSFVKNPFWLLFRNTYFNELFSLHYLMSFSTTNFYFVFFALIYLFIVMNHLFRICFFKYLNTQSPSFSDMPGAWRHEKGQIMSSNHDKFIAL